MINFKIFALLSILVNLVFLPAFNIFFAQDDFILIRHFSQNDLVVDLKNVFGLPTVSHWRPIDNLYYLITGNIFGKNYYGYHLISFLIHIFTSFIIFKIFKKIFTSNISAVFSAIIYAVHPAHFVALFWISGAALNIGFLFFILSIYLLLSRKQLSAITFYMFSLLASEAMLVGFFIFVAILIYQKKFFKYARYLITIFVLSILFIVIRLAFLTPKSTFDVYQLEFSSKVIFSIRYYLLRIAGFVEGFGKSYASLFLLLWLSILGFIFFKRSQSHSSYRRLGLGFVIIMIGLFPFVLMPNHMSPNYMIISIWGFSIILGLITRFEKNGTIILLAVAFLLISYLSVRHLLMKSWIIDRSKMAKELIFEIERNKLPSGSIINFSDKNSVSSREQYIALGTGDAITFWFREKNYVTCFAFLENCL